MKPAKATEILKEEEAIGFFQPNSDYHLALKLGTEALQRLIHARSFNHDWAIMPLPSESRD